LLVELVIRLESFEQRNARGHDRHSIDVALADDLATPDLKTLFGPVEDRRFWAAGADIERTLSAIQKLYYSFLCLCASVVNVTGRKN
jgi:hypothetical protein